jgi:hypothetical protein
MQATATSLLENFFTTSRQVTRTKATDLRLSVHKSFTLIHLAKSILRGLHSALMILVTPNAQNARLLAEVLLVVAVRLGRATNVIKKQQQLRNLLLDSPPPPPLFMVTQYLIRK